MEESQQPVHRAIKTFVLRQGRMTEAQQRDYEELSGHWCIPFMQTKLNFIDVFNRYITYCKYIIDVFIYTFKTIV